MTTLSPTVVTITVTDWNNTQSLHDLRQALDSIMEDGDMLGRDENGLDGLIRRATWGEVDRYGLHIVVRITRPVPTGLGALIAVYDEDAKGDVHYTRTARGWVSTESGLTVTDDTIRDAMHNGAVVLFEGVTR